MDRPATWWMIEPLRKYADFSGRARRREYWWFTLFVMVATVPLAILDVIVFGERVATYGAGPLTGIFTLALLLPSLGVSVRRMHDRDKSGWFLLLGVIPLIGGLILLFQFVQRGTVGDNRFGADPVG